MPSSSPKQHKANWMQAATVQYVKQIHPAIWEEAREAARNRWTEEHPDDPASKRGTAILWNSPNTTTD